MTEEQEAQSERARERGAAKARRIAKLAWSQSSFDLLASGKTPKKTREARKATVRRTDRGSPQGQRSHDPARDRCRHRPAQARRARALRPPAGREAHQGAALCGCGA